jgi:hypothetical protein
MNIFMKGCIAMRVMERGGRYKKETDYQLVPRAPKMTGFVPPAAGGNVLLATARQKRAYGIR